MASELLLLCSHCRTRLPRSFVSVWIRDVRTSQSASHFFTTSYPPHVSRVRIRSARLIGGSAVERVELKQNPPDDEGITQELDSILPPVLDNQKSVLVSTGLDTKSLSSSQSPTVISPHKGGHFEVMNEEELWKEQKIDWKKLPGIYLRLSKYRLSETTRSLYPDELSLDGTGSLVVLTALAGYTMAPAPLSVSSLFLGCAGTALCSAAANTVNQWVEVPFDSQMARTRNRVLVRQKISPIHAMSFGVVSGLTGSIILYFGVNSLTAGLGVFNIFLYTSVYTPLKRISIVNTWVGSVVGAIPPLMGWAACSGTLSPSALVMSGILYAWQFPHFNALSWGLRADYSRGGYRMMSVTDPDLCRRVALRYCLGLIPICTLAPVAGLTTWWFALDSLPLNVWFSYLGWKFYKDSDFKSSRKLFQFSLFYLPLVMMLMILNKKEWTS